MYKCCITGKTVPRYEPANKVILEIRPVLHKIMYQGGPARRGRAPEGPRVVNHIKGWEIVREGLVSQEALSKVPALEDLLAGLDSKQSIERTCFLKKRPKKKGKYQKRDTKIFRLKIVSK